MKSAERLEIIRSRAHSTHIEIHKPAGLFASANPDQKLRTRKRERRRHTCGLVRMASIAASATKLDERRAPWVFRPDEKPKDKLRIKRGLRAHPLIVVAHSVNGVTMTARERMRNAGERFGA